MPPHRPPVTLCFSSRRDVWVRSAVVPHHSGDPRETSVTLTGSEPFLHSRPEPGASAVG